MRRWCIGMGLGWFDAVLLYATTHLLFDWAVCATSITYGICRPRQLTSITNFPAHRFDLTALRLGLQPLALRTTGGTSWPAQYRHPSDNRHHFLQTLQGVGLVFFLTAVRLRLDNDHPLLADAMIPQRQQALLHIVRQGRSANIETQVDGARYLVDVLPTRTLCADGREFDFFVGNEEDKNGSGPVW